MPVGRPAICEPAPLPLTSTAMLEEFEQAPGTPWHAAGWRLARRALGRAVDILLPMRCVKCGVPVGEAGTLCAPCWADITFITAPLCACCGLPFAFAAPGDS